MHTRVNAALAVDLLKLFDQLRGHVVSKTFISSSPTRIGSQELYKHKMVLQDPQGKHVGILEVIAQQRVKLSSSPHSYASTLTSCSVKHLGTTTSMLDCNDEQGMPTFSVTLLAPQHIDLNQPRLKLWLP